MDKLEIIKSKIANREELLSCLSIWKFKEQKVVFTNGCFDLIHRGHVEYLAKAASYGNILVVGLNTDNSIRRIKGQNRPVQDEYSRAMIIAALQFVSLVTLFEENTPYELIKLIKPDFLVKGDDYKQEDIVGYDIVNKYGGEIITINITKGYSTSKIIDKISGKVK